MGGLLRKFDVAQERNALPVTGFGGQEAEFAEPVLKGAEAAARILIAEESFLVGVENQQAAVAVHDDQVAAGNVGDEPAQADYRRQFQGTGHDGSVAGPAAGFGGETVNLVRLQRGGFARRQVVSQDNDRLGQLAELFAAVAE